MLFTCRISTHPKALLAPRNDGGSGGALGQLAAQYGGLG
jgi:hypothetical protein